MTEKPEGSEGLKNNVSCYNQRNSRTNKKPKVTDKIEKCITSERVTNELTDVSEQPLSTVGLIRLIYI